MDFAVAREHMIAGQVRPWDVVDDRVLSVMAELERERFVPDAWRNAAYTDVAIPLPCGQRMFTPRMEGRILQAAAIKPGDQVLEIGAGSGYLSACIGQLGGLLTALEREPTLADQARENLQKTGVVGVTVETADASEDLPSQRFDVVILGGAIAVDTSVFEGLLSEGGRLFAITGNGPTQTAMRVERLAESRWQRESLFEYALPYLTGFGPERKFEF